MTGYTIRKILPSELILSQPKFITALLVITLFGIVLIGLSILTKLKVVNPPENFFNMFLGMGIIFFAGSLIFMIQKIPDSITFSKEKSALLFSENNLIYSKPFVLFDKLQITAKISNTENSKSVSYQLNLISNSGSPLLLSESPDKTDLVKTAESILSYIDIDFLSGNDLIHKGAGKYTETQSVFPPQNMMSIKSSSADGKSTYHWNCRKSLSSIILLGAVIFGFNYLLFTWAFPGMSRYNLGLYAGGAILFLMDFVFIATLLFYIFGSNIAEITDSAFSFHQHFFGFNINQKSFKREDISMISSGFTSDDNKITIFTKRGVDIVNELKISASLNNLNDTSFLMSLFPKVMELRNSIIEIDGTPLYYYEKMYLENEWSEKLNLKHHINP